MTTQSPGIKVRILGDDSDLNDKLTKSREAINKWAKVAVAGAAAAGLAITKNTAEASREVVNLSRLVGESTTQFQRNAAAAKTLGIEQEKYADIMKDVQDKVGDFIQTGAGPMADFFENIAPKVGVTADMFKRLNGRDALQLYVDSLEKANVSQNEMTFFMEAIASDASMLIPLLEDSGEQFEALGERAANAGAVLSDIDLAKMEAMQQSFQENQQLLKGLTNQIALQLAPVLQGLGDLFGENGDKAEDMRKAIEKAFEFTIKGSGVVADGVRGIHVVIKGIEAAFWGLSAVTAEIFEQMARGIDTFVVKPALNSINALIDGVNKLPGIDLDRIVVGDSTAVQKLTEISDAANEKMRETAGELHNLLMEPLPSKSLEDWVDLVQEKSEEAAKKIAETRQNTGLVVPDIGDGADDELAKEKEKQDALLEMHEKYSRARVDILAEQSAEEASIAAETAARIREIDGERFNTQLQGASSFFGNLSSLMNTESRKLFEVGKAAAIAQAVVDGIAAAVSSFKFGASIGGPVLGGAFAAASAVATGTQIAALAATSFGSGSSGAASAAAPSVSVPNTETGQNQGQAAPTGGGNDSRLFVEGLSGEGVMSMIGVRNLAEQLVQAQRDGVQVVLA